MTHKKLKQSTVVSNKCFRLLRLKHEMQSDVKVLKAVVDELDVLRLCRLLGMTVADEDQTSKHKFEFEQKGEDAVEIGCLFGKQLQIKDELTRMGFWSTDCEDGLPIEDQGVYCVKRSGDHRQLIVFAWLDSSLFEPEAIRNTPAYVLRFLITLSSNITCCLSQDDFGRVKSEVDAMSDSSSMRWNSCSVAFRVQKQVEQKDAIPCGEVTEVSIPRLERAKTAWFVGGVLSAVAVERATPSTTEMVPHNESMLIPQLAEWITMKQKYFAIHFPPKRVQLATHVRDELLVLCGQSSDDELSKLRRKHEKRLEDAKERLSREAYEYAENIYEEAIRNARMLFTVRNPTNSKRTDKAQKQYEGFLRKSEKCDVFRSMDYLDYKMVYLPERVQAHMKDLDEALKIDRKAFEDALLRILVDDPLGSESGGGFGVSCKLL
ncbi:hypothetical protein L917_21016 [Phytophthora nicotianae]|uniref:Uncharacterized protein n=1 Tax=Phytophthora nicotianae TaxID=4792 RepID=W2JYZ6_PHYNI|nr:hypothetical protein L917_21016 [Phytophthora nicotianae]